MSSPNPTVWLTTLGCAKNEVDSQKLDAVLDEAGYRAAASPEEADVVLVNTCAFIEDARRESVDTILDHAARKTEGARLVVLGCMAQRYGAELAEALPEADDVVGLDRYGELVDRLDHLTGWEPVRLRRSHMDILYEVRRPAPTTPYAYVKVAEGCDKQCTFCAIPSFRGAQRSRAPVNVREEVEQLTASGVTEVVLVAQDLAAYGRDIDAPGGIVELLHFLSDIEGLRRLRLLYLYPREIRPALITEMAGNPLVAPYFDLSLQHVAGDLLRAMKRPGDGTSHLALIERIRDTAREAALRSSFIVGFPGEQEADVEQLADFLVEAQLDWAGFFPYSPEAGTPAADLPGRVPAEVAAERLRHVQSIQDGVTSQRNGAQVGRTLEVLVDMVEEGVPVARSYREAPEIDGVITLDRGTPGEWVRAEITAAYETDLTAARSRSDAVIVEIVAVGTELLLGQIVNSNASEIGSRLADAGLDHYRQTVVGDNLARAADAIRSALDRADAVIITGGIGPTQDDLTREAICAATGRAMVFSHEYAERLTEWWRARGREMPETNLRQAEHPEGAVLIPNRKGTAPGIRLETGGSYIFALPGVPQEMLPMLDREVIPFLQQQAGGTGGVLVSRLLRTWGESESRIAGLLADLFEEHTNPTVAFLASSGEIKIRLTARAADGVAAQTLIAPVEAEVRRRLGAMVFGVDDDTIERVLLRLVGARGWTLGTAESATGGMVAGRLTSVAGASEVFRGSAVAYSPRLKEELLGVPAAVIEEHGVVSEATAVAMATGGRARLGVDVVLAVTGSAGPDELEQAAGTMVFAVATPDDVRARTIRLPGDRERVRTYAGTALMHLGRLAVAGEWWRT